MENLRELMMKRRFSGTYTRLNVAAGAETYFHKNGRAFLKEKVLSDVVRSGPIFDEVRAQLGDWVEQLTLNKNLKCSRHVDRNEGESSIVFFGDYPEGGGLFVETPVGVRHLQQKEVWHTYNGRHPHWTEEWDTQYDRYSIVAYRKPKKKNAE